jgi:glycosyltransferase involved in cell wall biosynthesis
MRIRFITSTPLSVVQGSGTFVGSTTLVSSLRGLGVTVDLITPGIRFPVYTLQRLIFNEMLRFRGRDDYDVTVGIDMDGYTLAGVGPSVYVASIKGVIADEMRFETGLTKATMRLQAACEKLNVHRADCVITTSQYASARIQELYGVSKAPRIVPEAIELTAWEKLFRLNPAQPDRNKFVVLSVCRFYPRKRLDMLLGAAQRLRSRITGLEVSIVGGGPEAKRLKDVCRNGDLQGVVKWRENIPQSELAREYNRCDVFCLPSVQEGFGIVFLEAMANSKAIVAVRAGAIPEVVKHGLLAEPDDEEALAEAIERLYREPALRKSLGAAGRLFVKQFDAPVVAELFLHEIEALAMPRTDARTAKRESHRV